MESKVVKSPENLRFPLVVKKDLAVKGIKELQKLIVKELKKR